jgi:hypothetical protein
VPPERPLEPKEPFPRAQARVSAGSGLPGDSSRRDDEGMNLELDARRVLTELGDGWPLAPREVDALVPATQHALRTGWGVDELIGYLAVNPSGVRSAAAAYDVPRWATTAGRESLTKRLAAKDA